MINHSWVGFVASRYFRAARRNGRLASSVFSSGGIAIGAATLVVVLGVMNGFQSGFIDSILSIDSHHARAAFPAGISIDTGVLESRLKAVPGVAAVLEFTETNTMAYTSGRRVAPLKIKAVSPDAPEKDPDFIEKLDLRAGEFPSSKGSIAIGAELARSLSLAPGDSISVLSVIASEEDGVSARTMNLDVSGIFRSGYYDFDSGLGIVSLETGMMISGSAPLDFGIKFTDRETRHPGVEAVVNGSGGELTDWRTYNRSFFGALRTEKSAMMLLVGLIFVVVGLNIYHAMKRNVFERMEEIAVMKAIGAESADVRAVFVMDGAIIGFIGAIAGISTGLLLAAWVNELIRFLESAASGLSMALSGFGGDAVARADLSIYAQSPFYMFEIPVRVYFPEVLVIFMAGTASAIVAAYIASARVPRYRPAEVLRNE
ncbi:MAG: ABC transporter permease [Spirochaetes bacterium]|nr:ABC transporter permease [Spirochaetota bacterium]